MRGNVRPSICNAVHGAISSRPHKSAGRDSYIIINWYSTRTHRKQTAVMKINRTPPMCKVTEQGKQHKVKLSERKINESIGELKNWSLKYTTFTNYRTQRVKFRLLERTQHVCDALGRVETNGTNGTNGSGVRGSREWSQECARIRAWFGSAARQAVSVPATQRKRKLTALYTNMHIIGNLRHPLGKSTLKYL